MTTLHHSLSFRALDLPPGSADCTVCGRRISREEWLTGVCPGHPTEPLTDRRTA